MQKRDRSSNESERHPKHRKQKTKKIYTEAHWGNNQAEGSAGQNTNFGWPIRFRPPVNNIWNGYQSYEEERSKKCEPATRTSTHGGRNAGPVNCIRWFGPDGLAGTRFCPRTATRPACGPGRGSGTSVARASAGGPWPGTAAVPRTSPLLPAGSTPPHTAAARRASAGRPRLRCP
jgi:hypothetical protein